MGNKFLYTDKEVVDLVTGVLTVELLAKDHKKLIRRVTSEARSLIQGMSVKDLRGLVAKGVREKCAGRDFRLLTELQSDKEKTHA